MQGVRAMPQPRVAARAISGPRPGVTGRMTRIAPATRHSEVIMINLPARVRAFWGGLIAPPELSDFARSRRAQMLHAILLSVFATHGVLLAIGAPFFFARKLEGGALVAIVLAAAAFSWWRMRRGEIALACHVISWTLCAVYSAMLLLSDSGNVGFYIPVVFIAAVLLGPAWGIAVGLAGVGVAALAFFGGEIGVHLPHYFPGPPATRLLFFITQSALTIVPFYVIGRGLTRALEHAGRELVERALAQQELQHSERRLTLALEAARTGIWEWDIASGRLTVTPQGEAVVGLREREFGGTYEDFLRLVHPGDVDRVAEFNLGILAGQMRGRAIEHRVILRDGAVRWIEGRGTLQRDAAGKPARVIGTVVDVTPRKLAERAMQESEDRYRAMIATMAEGMMLRDMQGNLLLCNPAAERIIGLKAEEMGRWSFPLDGWRTIREDGAPFPRDEHPVMITMRTGRPCSAVVMGIQRGDAPLTWISINSVALRRDHEDKPYAILTTLTDITGRKNAEKALTDSERRYRTILDTLVEGVIMRGPRREVLIANPASERILGVRPEDLHYENLRERGWRTCREDGAPFPERDFPFEIALRTGKPQYNVVMGIRRPDRELTWVSINAQPVFEPGATTPYAVVVSHTDITERKRAQQLLDGERMLLKLLVDNLPDDIFIIDNAGHYTMVNSAWLAQLGFSSDEGVLGRTVFDFFDAAMATRFDAENRRVIDTGIGLYNQNRPIRKPDGSPRWILTSKIPMRDARGQIVGIIGINRDVTELNNALDTLQQERNLLRAIIDSVPDPIYVKDREGRYVVMNEAGIRLRDLTKHAEIVGKSARDYFPAGVAAAIEREDRGVIDSGRPLVNSQRKSLEQRGGERWISMSKFPLNNGEGAVVGLVTINRDITDLRNIIEEVRNLNLQLEDRVRVRTQELQEANKELEAFSYSVSHDLRAPLRSISGFGNFLLKDNYDQLDDEGKGRLQRIIAASERMGQLIDDLLKLARISRQSMSLRKVNLQALATESIAALREAHPRRRVDVVIEPDLTIEADNGLMRVVIDNLLVNAWKFTGKRDDARIELGSTIVDGRRAYFVRDNGAGFEMTYAGKLFAPFQRMHTPQQFEGTGIGLATVKRIIERHHGGIWIESAVDRGTTVFFTVGATA
jgi:PAS domain S-box-containing protein